MRSGRRVCLGIRDLGARAAPIVIRARIETVARRALRLFVGRVRNAVAVKDSVRVFQALQLALSHPQVFLQRLELVVLLLHADLELLYFAPQVVIGLAKRQEPLYLRLCLVDFDLLCFHLALCVDEALLEDLQALLVALQLSAVVPQQVDLPELLLLLVKVVILLLSQHDFVSE